MSILYQHIENDLRGYHGISLENHVFITHLQTSVRNNLLDKEVQNLILNDLTGLLGTGFSSESILADIQALENAEPDDLREWRIGEAMAEVILEENFQCRFHWNELRDSRNPKGNKTGADLVGFVECENSVLFLFGEVKTSSETASRPPQVMTKADGIENQLKDLYSNRKKRQVLITYLKSKTMTLAADNSFKKDFDLALRTYYVSEHYQLIGVLVRDIISDEMDVSVSYNRIKSTILNPVGLKLVALYTSIPSSKWHRIIKGAIEE